MIDKNKNIHIKPFNGFWRDLKEWITTWKEAAIELYQAIKKFVTEDIWKINTKEQRPIHYYIKVFLHTLGIKRKGAESLANDNIGRVRIAYCSASLSFYSILALVPFIAAIFFITKGFGMDSYLKDVITQTFGENEKILSLLLSLANNIIQTSKNGMFGMISFLVFIWAVILLMMKIEQSFDDIWNTQKTRGFFKQLFYYLGFIIVSPFILILFLSILVFISNGLGNYGVKIWHFETISAFVQWLIYYAISVIAITVINKAIPNKKVLWNSAFKSALITAFAFVIVQFLYTGTQLMVTRLNAVYGAFAAVPLFLIWLNTSWTVLLVGAKVSAAFQQEDEKKLLEIN